MTPSRILVGPLNSSGSASGDFTFDNDQTFTCSTNPADYTNGSYSYTKVNRATIVDTNQYDDAMVTVTCYAPVVTKNAAASYKETHVWDITKAVDPASQSGIIGEVLPWTWTVNVSESPVEMRLYRQWRYLRHQPEPQCADDGRRCRCAKRRHCGNGELWR